MGVVYDTILSAIHNLTHRSGQNTVVVYDTILSAIHNVIDNTKGQVIVVYDTILSAMSKNVAAKIRNIFGSTKFSHHYFLS